VNERVFDGIARPRTRRQLLAAGVTPSQLRGPRWQRTSHGRYLPSGIDATACLPRILDAATRCPSEGAIGGWASARIHGVDACDGFDTDGRTPLDVPLVLGGSRIRRCAGVERWHDPLPAYDVVQVGGIRFTAPPRTCLDRMRRADGLREAVVVADQMTLGRLVRLTRIREYAEAHAGWRGILQARRALDLCDPMSRNAWETRMRMVWLLDAGLPRPMCNPPLFDLHEGLLGYPDLFDPVAGVVFEYDGSGHRASAQHDRDNQREERFEDHGLVVARVSRANLADRETLADRMRRTRQRGVRRDRRNDRWTLEVPPSWGAFGVDEADLHAALEDLW
jgi:hypothetical protein